MGACRSPLTAAANGCRTGRRDRHGLPARVWCRLDLKPRPACAKACSLGAGIVSAASGELHGSSLVIGSASASCIPIGRVGNGRTLSCASPVYAAAGRERGKFPYHRISVERGNVFTRLVIAVFPDKRLLASFFQG